MCLAGMGMKRYACMCMDHSELPPLCDNSTHVMAFSYCSLIAEIPIRGGECSQADGINDEND
jgi:hypothetical protein